MKLLLRQRVFAWFDSYDIYDEDGNVCYTVKGQLSWGHCFRIWDASGAEVGMIKQVVLTWLPRFDIYVGGRRVGTIRKELTTAAASNYKSIKSTAEERKLRS